MTDPIPFDAVALGSEERPAVTTTDSLVMCENVAANNFESCPDSRLVKSGSMQMKVSSDEVRPSNWIVARPSIGS